MTKRNKILIIITAILLVGWVAWHFMLDYSVVPETSNFKIDIPAWRKLALSGKEKLPTKLHSMVIGRGSFPRKAVIAGESFQAHPMAFVTYKLEYPQYFYIIDTAYDKTMHAKMAKNYPFYDANYDTLQKSMVKAKGILLTHEHADHVGGIARSAVFDEIKSHIQMTKEQIEDQSIERANFAPGQLQKLKPLIYTEPLLIAPGMVLIKAPGHSGGTQMIFIHLQSGAEFLLIGDIAWSMENIRLLRGRPWLISRLLLHEDREKVANQLRSFYNLLNDPDNKVHMISAHDSIQLDLLNKQGIISDGF